MLRVKNFFRKIIYLVPGSQNLYVFIRKLFHSNPKPDFSGWNMTTFTSTPWHKGGDDLAKSFFNAHLSVLSKIETGDFKLSQFENIKNKNKVLKELMWRHYIVYWSSRFSAEATSCKVKNLVECGVCDGLTVYFAMSSIQERYQYKSYLYDSWEGMKREGLLDSELEYLGQYSYLNISNTQKNLNDFKDNTIFIKGFIPESFIGRSNPEEISWLHIDLNAAKPTLASLEFFYERLVAGGVILFDDYAWHDYHETKLVVDNFFVGKQGIVMPLPTGQAIFFKLHATSHK